MFRNKKIAAALAGIVVGLLVFHGQPVFEIFSAHADANSQIGKLSSKVTDITEKGSLFFYFIIFLQYLFLKLAAFLVDPEAIYILNGVTTSFGGSDAFLLLRIWQISRDVMNIIFAFMLVAAALYTVVTANGDLVRERIAKFIVAVILVNFSWFFPRVILDVANVATASVYAIPSIVQGGVCQTIDENGNPAPCEYLKEIHIFPEPGEAPPECTGSDISIGRRSPGSSFLVPIEIICLEFAPMPSGVNTSLGMLHALYVNHLKLTSLHKFANQLDPADVGAEGLASGKLSRYLRFTIALMFVFLYSAMMFFPLITLVVLFFLRIPLIWVTICFMPFMFIGFVMGDKMANFDTMVIFKKFIAAAFMPTVTAIPLVAGFIMIGAGIVTDCPSTTGPAHEHLCTNDGISTLLPGVQNFWIFLWMLLSLFVMWKGFYTAAKIGDMFEGIVSAIESAGKNSLSFALKAPLASPLVALPGGIAPLQAAEFAGKVAKNPNVLINPATGKFRSGAGLKGLLTGGSGASGNALANNPSSTNIKNAVGSLNTTVKNELTNIVNTNNAGQFERLRSEFTRLAQQNGFEKSRQNARAFLQQLGITNERSLQQGLNAIIAQENSGNGNSSNTA